MKKKGKKKERNGAFRKKRMNEIKKTVLVKKRKGCLLEKEIKRMFFKNKKIKIAIKRVIVKKNNK